jgi:hypothetical protein
MPKRSTKPSIPVVDPSQDGDADAPRGRSTAGVAVIKVDQLSRRFDDYVDSNDKQLEIVREDIGDVREEVGYVREDVKGVVTHVGNLRVDVARLTTVTETINTTLSEQNNIKHVRMIAEVETGAAEKVARIEDTADHKKAMRAFWLKVAIVLVGLLGTVGGMLIEHYR